MLLRRFQRRLEGSPKAESHRAFQASRVIAKPTVAPLGTSKSTQVSFPPTARRPLFLFLYFSTKPHPFSHQTTLGQVRAALRQSASRIIVLPVDCRSIIEKLDATSPDFNVWHLALILFELITLFPLGTCKSRHGTTSDASTYMSMITSFTDSTYQIVCALRSATCFAAQPRLSR